MQKITITECFDNYDWEIIKENEGYENSMAIVKPDYYREEEYLAPYWYTSAKDIYDHYDPEYDEPDVLTDDYDLMEDIAIKVDEWFRSGGAETNNSARSYKGKYDCIAELCTIMYGIPYEATEFHGYSQGDWVECIYDTTQVSEDYLRYVEQVFMGEVVDLHFEDTTNGEDNWTTVTDDALWDAENSSDIVDAFSDLIGYDLDPSVIIYDEINRKYILGDEDSEGSWDESEDRLDRTTYDPRRSGNEYDIDTISEINESRRLRKSNRVMSSSRLHPSRRRSVKASRSVRRGRR